MGAEARRQALARADVVPWAGALEAHEGVDRRGDRRAGLPAGEVEVPELGSADEGAVEDHRGLRACPLRVARPRSEASEDFAAKSNSSLESGGSRCDPSRAGRSHSYGRSED